MCILSCAVSSEIPNNCPWMVLSFSKLLLPVRSDQSFHMSLCTIFRSPILSDAIFVRFVSFYRNISKSRAELKVANNCNFLVLPSVRVFLNQQDCWISALHCYPFTKFADSRMCIHVWSLNYSGPGGGWGHGLILFQMSPTGKGGLWKL